MHGRQKGGKIADDSAKTVFDSGSLQSSFERALSESQGKSGSLRERGLEVGLMTMRASVLTEDADEFLDAIKSCIRYGGESEAVKAATLLGSVVITVGADRNDVFADLEDAFTELIRRGHAAAEPLTLAYALSAFINATEPGAIDRARLLMEHVFAGRRVTDGSRVAALKGWALLATRLSQKTLGGATLFRLLPVFRALLDHPATAVKVAAAEALALVYDARWRSHRAAHTDKWGQVQEDEDEDDDDDDDEDDDELGLDEEEEDDGYDFDAEEDDEEGEEGAGADPLARIPAGRARASSVASEASAGVELDDLPPPWDWTRHLDGAGHITTIGRGGVGRWAVVSASAAASSATTEAGPRANERAAARLARKKPSRVAVIRRSGVQLERDGPVHVSHHLEEAPSGGRIGIDTEYEYNIKRVEAAVGELLHVLTGITSKSARTQREERQWLRDIHATVAERESPVTPLTVNIWNAELQGWAPRIRLETFRAALGPGFQVHLECNPAVAVPLGIPSSALKAAPALDKGGKGGKKGGAGSDDSEEEEEDDAPASGRGGRRSGGKGGAKGGAAKKGAAPASEGEDDSEEEGGGRGRKGGAKGGAKGGKGARGRGRGDSEDGEDDSVAAAVLGVRGAKRASSRDKKRARGGGRGGGYGDD